MEQRKRVSRKKPEKGQLDRQKETQETSLSGKARQESILEEG